MSATKRAPKEYLVLAEYNLPSTALGVIVAKNITDACKIARDKWGERAIFVERYFGTLPVSVTLDVGQDFTRDNPSGHGDFRR